MPSNDSDMNPPLLLVDDDNDTRCAIGAALEFVGVRVVLADSGAEALARIAEQRFFLILLDINMPDMNGFETAEKIIAGEEDYHTPIIIITGHRQQQLVNMIYESGAVDHMYKPLDVRILRYKVKIFFTLYQQEQMARDGEF